MKTSFEVLEMLDGQISCYMGLELERKGNTWEIRNSNTNQLIVSYQNHFDAMNSWNYLCKKVSCNQDI